MNGAGSKAFQDHFGSVAQDYASYRPTYPADLFHFLAELAPSNELAWDCACGTGQVAVPLSEYFSKVVATDGSAEQIRQARQNPRIRYIQAFTEDVPIEDGSVALITVGQALHWFDFGKFFSEVKRVLMPSGVIAAWCYELFRSEKPIDDIVDEYYYSGLEGYWPEERRHIEAGYTTIPFPFAPVSAPRFFMEACWNLNQVLGYLSTWSATQRMFKAEGPQRFQTLEKNLANCWGRPGNSKTFRWPISLLLGRAE